MPIFCIPALLQPATFTFDSVIGILDLFLTVMHAAAEILRLTFVRWLLRRESSRSTSPNCSRFLGWWRNLHVDFALASRYLTGPWGERYTEDPARIGPEMSVCGSFRFCRNFWLDRCLLGSRLNAFQALPHVVEDYWICCVELRTQFGSEMSVLGQNRPAPRILGQRIALSLAGKLQSRRNSLLHPAAYVAIVHEVQYSMLSAWHISSHGTRWTAPHVTLLVT